MIYAGIDVNIITHEKALHAGVEAFGLWVWGMCYAQIHETDGRLSRVAVMSALGEERRVLRRLAVRLVTSGLWVESECGSFFTIRNYDKKNQTAEEIKAKKEASADRVRKWRERRAAAGNANVTPPELVRTDPPPPPPSPPDNITRKHKGESDPQNVTPVTPDEEAIPTPTDSGARYAAAYAAGISRGKCAPWVWPETKYATWDLGKIIKGHGIDAKQKPYRGEQLLRFIEHTACEFASQVIAAKKAQYYSAFEPRGCLKWLNEVDMAEEARRVG